MTEKEKTIVVLVVVGAFFGGYLVADWRQSKTPEHAPAMVDEGGHQHAHGSIDVSGETAAPQVDLIVHQDPMAGRNLQLITKNFRFAPDRASTEHVPGEGHAHLYIDGKKIARLYGPWFHIAEPAPGTHLIKVTLNSNAHQDLVVDGKLVADEETLVVATR